MQKRSLSGALV